ncbi:MAG: L-seryl-tRNA(Sec) selenium transferase [Eubacterium sp.]|nr:L-seryl-tRNA(Sec) selenium transferase [Eubacterium sp.]
MGKEILRNIPKVDIILNDDEILSVGKDLNNEMKKEIIQSYLEDIRNKVLADETDELPSAELIINDIKNLILDADNFSLRRVINATGVVLHTNLGRAPLGKEVTEHIVKELAGYNTLEYNLKEAKRGSRYDHIEKLLCEITSAEAAMVVNNNAAGVFLVLNTLAQKKNVAISRGELVEIGGAFRVPEIMERSWADLLEIGTTNKTHLSDYERAIDENNAEVILKVHNSNFKIVGFTEEVEIDELCKLGKSRGVKVIFDLGAAFLTEKYLPGELQGQVPPVRKCIEAGCDIVCFSGDKLFGGAQAGIIIGNREDIEKIKKNPFTRMFRTDKLDLCVLEKTLRYYKDYSEAVKNIPTLKMLLAQKDELLEEAEELALKLEKILPDMVCIKVAETEDEPGGGSMPGVYLPGYAIEIKSDRLSADEIEERLRNHDIPIISRINDGGVLISLRTLMPGDDLEVIKAVSRL